MPERTIPPPPPPPPSDETGVPAPSSAAVIVEPAQPVSAVVAPASPVVAEPQEVAEPSEPPAKPLNVPAVFLDFLFSTKYSDSNKKLRDDFKLSEDDVVFIGDMDRMAMAGEIDGEVYATALEDEFKARMGDEAFKRLFTHLLAERLQPLGDSLKPTAAELAHSRGLNVLQADHYQIYTKPLTYSGAATEIAASAGFSIMGGPIRERLRELIISKLKGVRVDAQIVETLARGIDFGGLGLDPQTADRALRAMNDILKRAKVMSEDEYANWLADEAHKKASPVPVPAASASPASADDEEIARIQASMPQPVIDTSSELAKAVESTLQRLTYRPTDDYLAKRLRNVISSRLRDVRSALEVKQILMRDVKVGGVGLAAADADSVVKQIETAYQEFHVGIAQEEKSKIETQLEEQKRKVEERRRQEAEEHAKWFEEKIRSRKAGETQKTLAIEDMRRVMAGAASASPVDIKEQRAETAKFGPLVPVAAAGTPKPDVKVSPATVELAQTAAAARPRMDGVTYGGPQLVGLVGELKSLSVSEFRRLSKNPQEAAAKIRQKVETLAQESFEKKVEGVRAFQASPLQAAYMGLVGESFRTATPVVALAEEKRKAGGDTLSPDEIGAIIQLNSALHF